MLYDLYLEKKKEDSEKVYLFKCGKFYVILGEDVERLSDDLCLEKTIHSKGV